MAGLAAVVLSAFLELGIYPVNGVIMYTPSSRVAINNSFSGYVTLGFSAGWYGFFVNGEVNTNIEKSVDAFYFVPFGADYSIGVGWENSWLRIVWMHECSHPVVAYYPVFPGTFNWEGGVERVSVRFSLDNKDAK